MFVASAYKCQVMMCRCLGSNDRRTRIKLPLTVYRDFMQGIFFIRLEWTGSTNLTLPEQYVLQLFVSP